MKNTCFFSALVTNGNSGDHWSQEATVEVAEAEVTGTLKVPSHVQPHLMLMPTPTEMQRKLGTSLLLISCMQAPNICQIPGNKMVIT